MTVTGGQRGGAGFLPQQLGCFLFCGICNDRQVRAYIIERSHRSRLPWLTSPPTSIEGWTKNKKKAANNDAGRFPQPSREMIDTTRQDSSRRALERKNLRREILVDRGKLRPRAALMREKGSSGQHVRLSGWPWHFSGGQSAPSSRDTLKFSAKSVCDFLEGNFTSVRSRTPCCYWITPRLTGGL